MVKLLSRLGAWFVIAAILSPIVLSYSRVPSALAERSISPITEPSATTSSLIQISAKDPLLSFAEQYLIEEIDRLTAKLGQSSGAEKNQLETDKTFLELQIAIEQYDPGVIKAAKILQEEAGREHRSIDQAVTEARTALENLERTSRTIHELCQRIQDAFLDLERQIASPSSTKSSTELMLLGVKKQIIWSDLHEKHLPKKLEDLQKQQDALLKRIGETNANRYMHGRQKSAIIAGIQREYYSLQNQKYSLMLALQKYDALKKGANEEELYRLGLSDGQIAHLIAIQQGNTQASLRQDQAAKQKIAAYKGAVLGQATPGALSKLNKNELAGARTSSAAFSQRTTIPFTTKNVFIEEKEIYGLSKRPSNHNGTAQTSSLPGSISYKAVIYRPSPVLVEKLRTALTKELQNQQSGQTTAQKGEKPEDEIIKTLLDYLSQKNPQENAKKLENLLKNCPESLFQEVEVTGNLNDQSSPKSYWQKTAEQVIYGHYSEEFTGLGFAAEIAVSVVGIDIPMDIRDLVYDVQHWQWSKDHALNTALDAVAFVPVVGVVKKGKKIPQALERVAQFSKNLPGNTATKTEGVYVYYNRKLDAHYVGQSDDIARRLDQHIRAGNLDPNDAKKADIISVLGGKTRREIVEQFVIKYEFDNILRKDGGLANKINPLGETRIDFMPRLPESK